VCLHVVLVLGDIILCSVPLFYLAIQKLSIITVQFACSYVMSLNISYCWRVCRAQLVCS